MVNTSGNGNFLVWVSLASLHPNTHACCVEMNGKSVVIFKKEGPSNELDEHIHAFLKHVVVVTGCRQRF